MTPVPQTPHSFPTTLMDGGLTRSARLPGSRAQVVGEPWDGEPRPGAQPGPQQRPLEHFSQRRGPAQGIPKQQVVDRKRFRRGWRRGGGAGGRGGAGPSYVHSAVVSRWGWL